MGKFKDAVNRITRFSRSERAAIISILIFVAVITTISYVSKEPIITDIDTVEISISDTLLYRHRQNATVAPFDFDPNSDDTTMFKMLGFSPKQAAVIIKYRKKIGGYKTPEDFAKCFVVSDEKFRILKNFIKISDNNLDGIKTPSVSSATFGGEKESSFTFGREKQTNTASKMVAKINFNKATEAELIAINGIGARYAAIITERGKLLGGYSNFQQLSEIGVDEKVIKRCEEKFFISYDDISKIDINFADANTLSRHPYFTKSIVGRVLKQRELKGGWSNITEMKNRDILLPNEAKILAPYLVFNTL